MPPPMPVHQIILVSQFSTALFVKEDRTAEFTDEINVFITLASSATGIASATPSSTVRPLVMTSAEASTLPLTTSVGAAPI